MIHVISMTNRAMIALAGIGIVLMLVLVTADVTGRAVFNVSIPGIDTIVASYLMVGTIFLPLGLLHLLDENIAVDILRDYVPDTMKVVFDIIAHLLGAGFFALLGWLYLHVAIEAIEVREYVTGTWDVPIWPARILMPLGLAVATISAFAKLLLAFRALVSSSSPTSHDFSEPN